jgi:hypothetical protein
VLHVTVTRPPERRVLHFDIETRRVGFFTSGPFSPDGCEPIALATSWADSKHVDVWIVGEVTLAELLAAWTEMYAEAAVVSGHYILKFDLPVLQGALMEAGLGPLGPKYVSDTKQHLLRRGGISASQENLSEMYQLEASKFHMNDARWREAARLKREGLTLARKRVIGDVVQHKALRAKLLEKDWLKEPRLWRP